MAKYLAGDVVWCRFPQQTNPTIIDQRPGIILRVEMVNTTPYFLIAKITTTDNSHYITGKFVTVNSKYGKAMGIIKDSFIHLENIAKLPLFAIIKRMGTCPFMDELNKLCADKGIKFWVLIHKSLFNFS